MKGREDPKTKLKLWAYSMGWMLLSSVDMEEEIMDKKKT